MGLQVLRPQLPTAGEVVKRSWHAMNTTLEFVDWIVNYYIPCGKNSTFSAIFSGSIFYGWIFQKFKIEKEGILVLYDIIHNTTMRARCYLFYV